MKDLGEKVKYDGWQFLGYPVFGGWLPYVGFRKMHFTKEELTDMLGYEVSNPSSYNPFVLEWLGRGISIGRVKVS